MLSALRAARTRTGSPAVSSRKVGFPVGAEALNRVERRLLLSLFALTAATFLLFCEGAVTGYDGGTMYEVTKSMVERGTVAVGEEWNTLPGREGLQYSRYGPGLSLLAVLPYLVARPLAQLSGDPEAVLEAAVSAIVPVVAAALVVSLYALARRMGARVGPALLGGIGGVAGTFLLPYTKEFFSEPLTALGLVLATERLLARRPLAAGSALGLAVLTRSQNVLLAPVFVLVTWRREGLRSALTVVGGIIPSLVLVAAYNMARFEHPLRFGYEDVGFTTPLTVGLSGLLLNPYKSVLLFAPVVVLLPPAFAALWQRNRAAFALLGANLSVTLVVTATWFAWHGGWSWGPRLLLPGLIPALAAIPPWLTTARRTRAAVLLVALGLAVSLPALVVPTQAQQLEAAAPDPSTHFLDTPPVWSPSAARQAQLVVPTTTYSARHLFSGQDDGRNYLRYLSLWQFGASRVLGPLGLAAAATATTVLLAVVAVAARMTATTARQLAVMESPAAGTTAQGFAGAGA